LHEYPEEQLRDLVKQPENPYKKYGRTMRESIQHFITEDIRAQMLDDEINELLETLKYTAIAGERLDGTE
jgi:hypothetical protein